MTNRTINAPAPFLRLREVEDGSSLLWCKGSSCSIHLTGWVLNNFRGCTAKNRLANLAREIKVYLQYTMKEPESSSRSPVELENLCYY